MTTGKMTKEVILHNDSSIPLSSCVPIIPETSFFFDINVRHAVLAEV